MIVEVQEAVVRKTGLARLGKGEVPIYQFLVSVGEEMSKDSDSGKKDSANRLKHG